MLTQRKRLAKSSRTPGKTQLVNFFLVNQQYMLVDLPGYGYAKSARSERGKWTDRSMNYFLQRPSLLQVFVLVDGSIPVQKIDKEFVAYLHEQGVSFSVIVTKTDKAKQKDLNTFVQSLKSLLSSELPIFLTSSEKKRG
jgi:GTP-binding protein